jgi:antiviral helicase SKI2
MSEYTSDLRLIPTQVYDWACGVSFAEICSLTDVQEGSIVRTVTRLDELCREVGSDIAWEAHFRLYAALRR